MILGVAGNQQFGGFPPQFPGGRSGHAAAVHGIKVATGRQNVVATACRRTGRARLEETPRQGRQQTGRFALAALIQRRRDRCSDALQHLTGALPLGGGLSLAGQKAQRQQFDTLDRVTGTAPRIAADCAERLAPVSFPGLCHGAVERVETQAEILGYGPLQAGIGPFAATARNPRKRRQQIVPQPSLGRLPEDVQAVADLHLLQFAQIGVEFFQRHLLRVGSADAGVAVEADVTREIEDLPLEQPQPPRIAAGGFVIFVHQRLQVLERSVAFGTRQRRRQVIDDDRRRPALCLGPLARVVDDEGIDMGNRSEHRLRVTAFRQRQRLARQPFQVAVLTHVDDCVRGEGPPQKGVEGDVSMRRHEIRRVIAFLRVDIVAARRLDADDNLAEAAERQGEPTAFDTSRRKERIVGRISPSLGDFGLNGLREAFEKLQIVAQRKHLANATRVDGGIGRPFHQVTHQCAAVGRPVGNIVSRRFERHQDGGCACRRVQPDTIAEPPVPVRVVGHDQRDAPVPFRSGAK